MTNQTDTKQQQIALRTNAAARRVRATFPAGTRVEGTVDRGATGTGAFGTVVRHNAGTDALGGTLRIKWDNGAEGRSVPTAVRKVEAKPTTTTTYYLGTLPNGERVTVEAPGDAPKLRYSQAAHALQAAHGWSWSEATTLLAELKFPGYGDVRDENPDAGVIVHTPTAYGFANRKSARHDAEGMPVAVKRPDGTPYEYDSLEAAVAGMQEYARRVRAPESDFVVAPIQRRSN